MKLVYASRTSNIARIVEKLGFPEEKVLNITEGYKQDVNEDFFLLTYTDFLGSVPKVVEDFLEINHKHLKGVAASGNRNFGSNFCLAADKIAEKYGTEVLAKFELSGNDREINEFKNKFYDR